MTTANRPNRKSSDADLIRLNSVGLSLATIAKIIGCHPTTVTQRLHAAGVQPADTRHSFMERTFKQLPPYAMEWVADQLNSQYSINDFVRDLLLEKYKERNKNDPVPH